jgi:DNA-3-methyladenine glycosylase
MREQEILEEVRRERWMQPEDFGGDIHELAKDLLGRVLLRREAASAETDPFVGGMIVEVEVYLGPQDPETHARSGRPTERNRPMFGPAGHAYVYKIYGMYDCLNVTAPPRGGAGAILIRACEPMIGLEVMAQRRNLALTESPRQLQKLLSGPGKLCQAMHIDRALNGLPLTGEVLGILERKAVDLCVVKDVQASPRIGLNRATCSEATDWLWRYCLAGSRFVSR